MLIGLPATGKSTFLKNQAIFHEPDCGVSVLSTDRYIDQYAETHGKTYNQAFPDAFSEADKQLKYDLERAIKENHDIYWDQTNLSVSSRKKKLALIPSRYTRTALTFLPINEKTWKDRLNSRPGKVIPEPVLESMTKTYQAPTVAEGFDFVSNPIIG